MNMRILQSELSNCKETCQTRWKELTEGEQYLIINVFFPFTKDPENTVTDHVDFSAFTEDDLVYLYTEAERFAPKLGIIAESTLLRESLMKAKPFFSKSEYI